LSYERRRTTRDGGSYRPTRYAILCQFLSPVS